MSKLLEAENAQRQHEKQPERESNTGKETSVNCHHRSKNI
jgi:hypothetical protein